MYFFSHQKISLARAKGLALFVLLFNCQIVTAQSNRDAGTEKNLDLPYQSVLGTYQSYKEQPISSWREVNDEVEKIGGWRAYAREASKSDADQVGVNVKTEALPANNAHQHHGGSHE